MSGIRVYLAHAWQEGTHQPAHPLGCLRCVCSWHRSHSGTEQRCFSDSASHPHCVKCTAKWSMHTHTHTHIYIYDPCLNTVTSLVALPTMRETQVWTLGREYPLEMKMAACSSILAWKIPWMEDPGWLPSMGSQRVRHDWATSLSCINTRMYIFFFRLFSIMGNCKILSTVPCATNRSLLATCFMYSSVHMVIQNS